MSQSSQQAVKSNASQFCPVQQEEDPRQSKIPVWSAYSSLLGKAMPVTRVHAFPLIAAPAREWNTLLTVLMQAQTINVKVAGQRRKTTILLDMGLYMPAKKLQLARHNLSNIILRPGELHVVMAQLTTIGAYTENSGIDMAWVESDLYDPSIVKRIIEGNNVKRAEAAHLVTLQCLFNLYQEAFLNQEAGQCKEVEVEVEVTKAVKRSVLKRRKKGDSTNTQGNGGCCRVHGHHE